MTADGQLSNRRDLPISRYLIKSPRHHPRSFYTDSSRRKAIPPNGSSIATDIDLEQTSFSFSREHCDVLADIPRSLCPWYTYLTRFCLPCDRSPLREPLARASDTAAYRAGLFKTRTQTRLTTAGPLEYKRATLCTRISRISKKPVPSSHPGRAADTRAQLWRNCLVRLGRLSRIGRQRLSIPRVSSI